MPTSYDVYENDKGKLVRTNYDHNGKEVEKEVGRAVYIKIFIRHLMMMTA